MKVQPVFGLGDIGNPEFTCQRFRFHAIYLFQSSFRRKLSLAPCEESCPIGLICDSLFELGGGPAGFLNCLGALCYVTRDLGKCINARHVSPFEQRFSLSDPAGLKTLQPVASIL